MTYDIELYYRIKKSRKFEKFKICLSAELINNFPNSKMFDETFFFTKKIIF